MSLYEIVIPYHTDHRCDCHESLESLFSRLAQKLQSDTEAGFDGSCQSYEIQVIRWESWDGRENRPWDNIVVLDLDQMKGHSN